MKRYTVIWLMVILISDLGMAQSGYELLQSERTIDRPLNVHAGQIRIIGGYDVAISRSEFVGSNRIELIDQGLANIGHEYRMGIKYGIIEYLEFELLIRYSNTITREAEQIIFSDINYKIIDAEEQKGFWDPYFGLNFRVPQISNLSDNRTDLIFSAGMALPTAAAGPQQPKYNLENTPDPTFFSGNVQVLQRINQSANGIGAAALNYGVKAKHRMNDLALSLFYNYSLPLNESTHTGYIPDLVNGSFSYEEYDFEEQNPDLTFLMATVEYQAFSFANFAAGFVHQSQKNGWSLESNRKLSIPDARLFSALLNYEVIVTPKLWISQVASFPVMGQNQRAPFMIQTNLRYNFFVR